MDEYATVNTMVSQQSVAHEHTTNSTVSPF